MKRLSTALAALASLALSACLGNSGNSQSAPANVQAFAGDGAISVSWDVIGGDTYWVFYALDPSLAISNNWTSLLGAGSIVGASTPAILCGQINNPNPTNYFPEMYFSVNARTGTAPGGPGSMLVSAAPRAAGGPAAPWIVGTAMTQGTNTSVGVNLSAVTYAPVTPCGYAGRPASGELVAVGPSGTIFFSVLSADVAGPLSHSYYHGNNPLVWKSASVPVGFHEDLLAVAAYSYGAVNAAAPAITFVAVGKNGTILRSVDTINWQQVYNVPTTANLYGVAVAGGQFVAVGDSGVVLNSADQGLTWTENTAVTTVSGYTLNAIHCASNSAACVAVGANGTTLWSYDGGRSWTRVQFGTNNWTVIGYGNNNANADSIVSDGGGVLTIGSRAINTWVVGDAVGNLAYTNTNASGGLTWTSVAQSFTSSIVAIDYTTRFLVMDAIGNTYVSENGYTWSAGGSSGLTVPVSLVSNGMGYVAIGSDGTNATSF